MNPAQDVGFVLMLAGFTLFVFLPDLKYSGYDGPFLRMMHLAFGALAIALGCYYMTLTNP